MTCNRCLMTCNRCLMTCNRCLMTWNRCYMTWNRCLMTWNRCYMTWNRCLMTWNRCLMTWNRCYMMWKRCYKTWNRWCIICLQSRDGEGWHYGSLQKGRLWCIINQKTDFYNCWWDEKQLEKKQRKRPLAWSMFFQKKNTSYFADETF